MRLFSDFDKAIHNIITLMHTDSMLVPPSYWQSTDVSNKPEMATYEMQNICFTVMMTDYGIDRLVKEIQPSMPWAEAHFLERVCGEPLNPGKTWEQWPWALKADSFRDGDGQFNHNYMERYFPRWAGKTRDGSVKNWDWSNCAPQTYDEERDDVTIHTPNRGIRHQYGDLLDVVDLFIKDPLTRQAFLPIFFPEDTGVVHGGRVPCTLGYHFTRRNSRLHVNYFIRSCDLLRHFRDDIYLTARLNLWLIDQLKAKDPGNWDDVLPGNFTMFITSLHMFRNDWIQIFNEAPPKHIGAINEHYDSIAPRPRPEPAKSEDTGADVPAE